MYKYIITCNLCGKFPNDFRYIVTYKEKKKRKRLTNCVKLIGFLSEKGERKKFGRTDLPNERRQNI